MNWEENIRANYDWRQLEHLFEKNGPVPFTEVIWRMSQEAFDTPREIQVVIDAEDNLFMNVGTAGYVDFPVDMEGGMKLPLKCWIHTHPFGSAYWSGTDMKTLKTWKPLLNSAIVLGYREHLVWNKYNQQMRHSRYAHVKMMLNPLHPDNAHLYEEE